MKKLYIFVLLLTTLIIAGCSTQKNISSQHAATISKTETLISQTIRNQPAFMTFNATKAKLLINYEQRSISSNATITMVQDSIIIFSIQPLLGIELMRIEATGTDLMVLDKMNRRYVQMSYDELQQKTGLPITFADLQALAMNRLFILGQPQSVLLKKKSVNIQPAQVQTQTLIQATHDQLNYRYCINDGDYLLMSTTISPEQTADNEGLSIKYDGHATYGQIVYPNAIDIDLNIMQRAATLHLTMPNIEFNQTVNAKRVKLSSYKKTTLGNILTGK
ncbi:MAG: DUF4292 domain-containing protein [Paludibacteraceae bacterium]|nr:DUF4292 domain-containing protein [Paludibacteraceae bacterium]